MKHIIAMLAILLLVTTAAIGAVAVKDDGTYSGEATVIDFVDSAVTYDGSKATVDTSAMSSATITTATITNLAVSGGTASLSASGANITLLDSALTKSGTDLYWAGQKLTN